MSEPVLSVSALKAGYGARNVLDGIDWEVRPGESWAILGPNGAGKSTLLRVCLGLHPKSSGEVTIAGRPIGRWSRAELARKLAWVPQSFDASAGFTGLELTLMGRSPRLGWWGLPSGADLRHAEAVLEELGISHLAARRTSELSGGEQRLLWLARALVQETELLFLDEPTAFLDLRHQVEALRRLKTRAARGLAVVAVLHDVNLAAAFTDQVLLLERGRVLAAGPTRDVLSAARLERLYGIGLSEARSAGGQILFAPRTEP